MEIKMKPVPLTVISGHRGEKLHKVFAKEAVKAFLESGEQAVELEMPKLDVRTVSAIASLRAAAAEYGVHVKYSDTKKYGKHTYLYKAE